MVARTRNTPRSHRTNGHSRRTPQLIPWSDIARGERRPAAMRCLNSASMNTLVEDQLARLRAALDSPTSTSVQEQRLHGNRIFFGRYTSDSSCDGLQPASPRRSRRRSSPTVTKASALFERCVDIESTQEHACEKVRAGELKEADRFLFSSVDGSELVSRWDMQADPPDILISNISMLGAMLNREVDAPIFERTRAWLTENDDAYFYLVLDELHLHRGTAGTEVAYLVRTLFERLGLTEAEHRHKLRILASSASLPVDGVEGQRSRSYLWDMFGDHGTFSAPDGSGGRRRLERSDRSRQSNRRKRAHHRRTPDRAIRRSWPRRMGPSVNQFKSPHTRRHKRRLWTRSRLHWTSTVTQADQVRA